MKNSSAYWIVFLFVSFFISCNGDDKNITNVLNSAGENRRELEKVLKHYQDSTIKLKAAEFLIGNMAGLSVSDSTCLDTYWVFCRVCDSIRKAHREEPRQREIILIDSLWKTYNDKGEFGTVRRISLAKAVKAEKMIAEIDLAFKAWKENVFTKECSFQDFCEYILPFSYGNAFLLDDDREHFYHLHGGHYYKDKSKSLFEETDSLLSFYEDIIFNSSKIAAFSVRALMQLGGSNCIDRGTFNMLLLSALGIPVAMDFVPAWGNRNSSHYWNVLIVDGKHYAFDPFEKLHDCNYNELYANTGVYDLRYLSEFRTPKIYRKTYSIHLENTLLGKGIAMDDIPPLFRNFKKKDVSAEYFEAVDVTVDIQHPSQRDAEYAYLCVFDSRGWVPVQFGKIENRKAVFKGMGRNIAYLPAYYEKGKVIAAGVPFLLKKDGTTIPLEDNGTRVDSLVTRSVMLGSLGSKPFLMSMYGAVFMSFGKHGIQDTLCNISEPLRFRRNVFDVPPHSRTRFVRINLPSDSIALGELAFYTAQGKIPNVKIVSSLKSMKKESELALFDRFSSTGYLGKAKGKIVDIDLGREYELTSIVLVPYIKSQMYKNSLFELLYWKEGEWKSLDIQKGNRRDLFFKDVPGGNTLFRLKQITRADRIIKERIFLYIDDEIIWL